MFRLSQFQQPLLDWLQHCPQAVLYWMWALGVGCWLLDVVCCVLWVVRCGLWVECVVFQSVQCRPALLWAAKLTRTS